MNRSNSSASLDVIHIVVDLFFQILALLTAIKLWGRFILADEWKSILTMFLIFVFVFLLSNRAANVYNSTLFFYLDRVIRRETMSFINGAVSVVLIYVYCLDHYYSRSFFVGFLVISYVYTLMNIMIFRDLVDRILSRKHVPRCAYIGSKESYNLYRYFVNKTSTIVNEIGYISLDDDDDSLEYIGSFSNLEEVIRTYNIDQVIIMQKRDTDVELIQSCIDLCVQMGITCRVVAGIFNRKKGFSYNSSMGTYSIMTYHTVCMNTWQAALKRVFDIVFSAIGIIITFPIMIITAIAIKMDSPGPVIYKQVRVGKNGRHFRIWKFRSMYIDADEKKEELMDLNEIRTGMMFKIKDDPRVTRVGKIIRRFSIDELPQFFNVLAGSMSFVGTRPPTLDEVEKYTKEQWRRISIKPGITGSWQTSGRSNITDFNEVVEMDTDYIDNWSPWSDVKIMAKTFFTILGQDGAY